MPFTNEREREGSGEEKMVRKTDLNRVYLLYSKCLFQFSLFWNMEIYGGFLLFFWGSLSLSLSAFRLFVCWG